MKREHDCCTQCITFPVWVLGLVFLIFGFLCAGLGMICESAKEEKESAPEMVFYVRGK